MIKTKRNKIYTYFCGKSSIYKQNGKVSVPLRDQIAQLVSPTTHCPPDYTANISAQTPHNSCYQICVHTFISILRV